MPRIRTIPEAVKTVRATDPETALTAHALRLLVLNGSIPHVKVGAKRLVDVDLVERYLSGAYIPPKPPQAVGIIRPIYEGRAAHG